MLVQNFKVDKSTQTFADELLAAGFVAVLQELLKKQALPFGLTQTDKGNYYEIATDVPLNLEKVELCDSFYLIPLIETVKNQENTPIDFPRGPIAWVDYEKQKEIRTQYFEAYKNLSKTAKRADFLGQTDPELANFQTSVTGIHPYWDIFRLINPSALIGYNALVVQWFEVGEAQLTGRLCRWLCEYFTASPNNSFDLEENWKKIAKQKGWKNSEATASQFFNPSQGKGINKLQPNGVGLGNVKNFWVLEWLKAVGFYQIALTKQLQGSKDRKTYVPVYGQMSNTLAQPIQEKFGKAMQFAETAIKSDIFTVIRYLKTFLKHIEQGRAVSDIKQYQHLTPFLTNVFKPADFMRGFQVAFYKDLGNAVTTMNLSFINIPGWVVVTSPADIELYQTILKEHEDIVRQFAENKGDENDLLNLYRDFIVADNLTPFFEFTAAYSTYLINRGDKAPFPPRKFQVENLRRLFVNTEPKLKTILDSPGFINIAYAIRQSTITAQYRKKQNDRRYDVRYGLGRELIREAQYPDKFVAILSDFLHKYNAENAQVMENRPGPYRRMVKTSDIQEILYLIDEFGSPLIANLLVAYGYARDSRTPHEEGGDDHDFPAGEDSSDDHNPSETEEE